MSLFHRLEIDRLASHPNAIRIRRLLVQPTTRSRVRYIMGILSCVITLALLQNLIEGVTIPHASSMEGSEDKADYHETKVIQAHANTNKNSFLLDSQQMETTKIKGDAEGSDGGNKETENDADAPTIGTKIPKDQPYGHNPPPSLQSNHSKAFTDRWCDLNRVSWFPTGPQKSWQMRAPYFLIPGAKYSGTAVLASMLLEKYPESIVPPARGTLELNLFRESSFRRYVTQSNEKTKVYAARERMYARDYPTLQLRSSPETVSLDASPGYLYYSSLLPRRILCVMPWIKLVVVLRNPVDRIYHQYLGAKKRGWKKDMESWIEKDLKLMQSVGMVQNGTIPRPLDISRSTEQEDLAWYKYHRRSHEGPVGRSLYDIQLRHWFQAMRAAGKDPAASVLIVRTEQLIQHPDEELARIFQFLQPPGNTTGQQQSSLSSKKSSKMRRASWRSRLTTPKNATAPAMRRRLDNFYAPYNRRLEELLEQYGVGNGRDEPKQ